MYGEHIPVVPGLPFSAKVELELANQLQDGTLISHKTYNLTARDSRGRTHNESRNWINPAMGAEPRLIRIELYDPSTRTRTNVFPLTKAARQWIASPAAPPATPSTPTAIKPETTKENIGSDSIEGLPVRGSRVSQTYLQVRSAMTVPSASSRKLVFRRAQNQSADEAHRSPLRRADSSRH